MVGQNFDFHTSKLSTSMETNSSEQLRKYATIEVNDFSLQTMEKDNYWYIIEKTAIITYSIE